MKKVLILTYYWPPGSGPGVQRWLKFCKYLPENGWEPIIITVKNGSYPSEDKSLEEDVPSDLKVIRTSTLEPFAIYNALRGKKGKSIEVGMGNIKGKRSWFARLSKKIRANVFVPDARLGWNIYSLPEALRVMKVERPDLLITTGPPHSTHLVGERLHREKGIPWIADLRDPWTNIYYNAFLDRSERTKKRDKELEDLVLSSADAVITASPGLNDEFSSRAKKIDMIPNGYDEDDILHLNPTPFEKFAVSYVGNLKAVQNVPAVWAALFELIEESTDLKNDLTLKITGNISDEVAAAIKEAGIMDNVELLPFVPHKEAIERMMASHALLLPIPNQKGNKVILTGKIFEYLATRRPILSIGPTDGNASDILSMCGKEPMIGYHDKEAIKKVLLKWYEEYSVHKSPLVTGNDQYKKYSRRGTTNQLSNLLNDVIT